MPLDLEDEVDGMPEELVVDVDGVPAGTADEVAVAPVEAVDDVVGAPEEEVPLSFSAAVSVSCSYMHYIFILCPNDLKLVHCSPR